MQFLKVVISVKQQVQNILNCLVFMLSRVQSRRCFVALIHCHATFVFPIRMRKHFFFSRNYSGLFFSCLIINGLNRYLRKNFITGTSTRVMFTKQQSFRILKMFQTDLTNGTRRTFGQNFCVRQPVWHCHHLWRTFSSCVGQDRQVRRFS